MVREDIQRLASRLGAELVGFADVSCLPVEVTDGLTRAVSVAVTLDPAVIDGIREGPTAEYLAEYERTNALLDGMTERIADFLKEAGHRAQAFRATAEQIDRTTLATRLQHKTPATRAGLGWIGKSGLLITREYGAAVRLGTVLTNAPFETNRLAQAPNCGDCRQCAERCPARAVKGESWTPGMERERIVDAMSCLITAKAITQRLGLKAIICGMCINACPWTQRYLARALKRPDISIAAAQDLGAVRQLFREYEASLPFDLSFQNFEEELAALPGRYAPPSGRMLLARHGDAFVGCVALRQIGDDTCEMKRLFVQPALRGKSIGRALALAIIEQARRIGYKRMRLDTVLEPAKRLYRSLGFREIPPYQHVPIEGVIFMELEL